MSIHVRGLTKEYGIQKAVNDVSFSVNQGHIVGFIGPNGAGKSTTMKIITGYIQKYGGSVEVNGMLLSKNLIDVKRQIGYLPEHNPLYHDMYVREYLSFVAGVYKLGRSSSQRVRDVIEMTGLGIEQHKKIGSLSKGFRQRVGLASAMIHDPAVLVLDEPTTGLDPNQIVEIRNLIATVGQRKTVMLSTHIMQEVEAICHRVIIINKGTIVVDDTAANVSLMHSRGEQKTVAVAFAKPVTRDELLTIPGVVSAANDGGNTWILVSGSGIDARPAVFDYAVGTSNQVLHMVEQQRSLEDIFRDVTR
jgi:ABC-2 type transport system ATP-binding protein